MARFLVGLTGGLASGKSTVAEWLEKADFLVVDADQLVASLYEPDGDGARVVRGMFGDAYLDANGAVDRGRLAERVFSDAAALARLEAAIHPLVGRDFAALAERTRGIVVLEVTLLVESGLAEHFDLVVTVEAEETLRRERALGRGLSEAQVEARLAMQGDGEERRAGAHRVIRNDGTLPALREQVDDLIADVRELASLRESGEK